MYPEMMDERRQTGRTTRMLKAAISCATFGEEIAVVVMADNREKKRAEQMVQKICYEIDVDVTSLEKTLRVETPFTTEFDWRTLRPRFFGPKAKSFVDHWTIESQFGGMLKELYRYDLRG